MIYLKDLEKSLIFHEKINKRRYQSFTLLYTKIIQQRSTIANDLIVKIKHFLQSTST